MKENKIYNLLELAKQPSHPRKLGRFKVSELYNYLNPQSPYFIDPEDFFKVQEMDDEGVVRTQHGVMMHNYFESLLEKDGWKVEQKMEYPYKDIVLVGVADAINDTIVMDLKDSMTNDITPKDAHTWQVKAYLSMFDKQEGYIAQPYFDGGIYLRLVKGVRRDDVWFHDVLEKLVDYNQLVKHN